MTRPPIQPNPTPDDESFDPSGPQRRPPLVNRNGCFHSLLSVYTRSRPVPPSSPTQNHCDSRRPLVSVDRQGRKGQVTGRQASLTWIAPGNRRGYSAEERGRRRIHDFVPDGQQQRLSLAHQRHCCAQHISRRLHCPACLSGSLHPAILIGAAALVVHCIAIPALACLIA